LGDGISIKQRLLAKLRRYELEIETVVVIALAVALHVLPIDSLTEAVIVFAWIIVRNSVAKR
jgi:hypothetical protein